jgi:hypothetical protein
MSRSTVVLVPSIAALLKGSRANRLASFRINLPRKRGRLSQSAAPSVKIRRPSDFHTLIETFKGRDRRGRSPGS